MSITIENGECLHIVQYGTFIENRYFLGEYKKSFDLIKFNANIVAYASNGITAFITKLVNKSYFIDPQTHAFQHDVRTVQRLDDNKNLVLKKSIENLANIYGSVINENVGKRKLDHSDFSGEAINTISYNVLKFELTVIENATKSDVKEFIDYTGDDLKPEFLIAPYCYLEPDNLKEELLINQQFISESLKLIKSDGLFSNNKLFAEIVINKDILINNDNFQKVLEAYEDYDVDGFIIWIDNFYESSNYTSKVTLKAFTDFIIRLNEYKKPIINLHGSYFSIVLSGKDYGLLAGVGHGIEYGEFRPVIPVGGGVPLSKFYFPQFHKRVDYHPDAENILKEMNWVKDKNLYHKKVCKCWMCENLIGGDVTVGFSEYGKTKKSEKNNRLYPTPDAMDKSRKHYLNTKIDEYRFCKSSHKTYILQKLRDSISLCENIKSYSFGHIKKWVELLDSI